LAIVAEGRFPAGEVVRFVEACREAIPWIEEIAVVDEYAGPPIPPGKKSLTYAISYRAADRTLTDAEVNEAHAELSRRIFAELGVAPR
jgi:phenylalanyl-tRNA synthetase beta chain